MIADGSRVAGAEPHRGNVPRTSTSLALAERERGTHVPATQQWATRLTTGYADLTVDDGRLLGRPRDQVGFVHEICAESLGRWADATVPQWQLAGMTVDDWSDVVGRLIEWVRQRDAATVAATPADARRFAELSAARARSDRRAELERARLDTDAELARLDRGEPVDPEPARRGGWLRRTPVP